ncbi:DUF4870 family protein [Aurantiacibacter luteus]|uniref:DUF4870 domain-containing protein n=1 Tax=Aurantiacibacter luteus TaxID=1581420 RepID=A0A0G9MY07_9SPHN|nr:hypothetical protein [Aurantiacibacter luteus]KLE34128.1 hypothetical protein AAW00_07550 [Aurantiacibacter luteus]
MDDSATGQNRDPGPAPGNTTGITLSRAMIVALLFVASVAISVTSLIGVVLAYVWRGDAGTQDWERTHFTYLIRTFWIGLAAMGLIVLLLVGGVASNSSGMLLLGALPAIAIGIWGLVRSVVSLVRASNRQPMPDPQTLWI